MNPNDHENEPIVTPVAYPLSTTTVDPEAIAEAGEQAPDLPKVGARYIWLMVLAQFGVFMAFITPIAISLAVRLGELAPNNQEYLGYITGAGALWVMLTAPFMGIWSDRTRSRLGRRRPFMIGGMIVGVLSLVVMALAPSVLLLGAGWILAQWGWGTVLGNLQNSTADRLPESQRGKVAGLTGFATQVAPVIGVIATMGLTGDPLLLFLVPGVVGVVLVTLFVTLVHEDDSRGLSLERIGFAGVLGKYVYNPRRFPDFSWNWLGRFLFYFGLTLNTTFTAFFFADRLGLSITEVSGVIGTLGAVGVLATTAGALGGGFMSDRFRRRKVFLVIGGAIMAVGMVTMALSSDLALLFAGLADRLAGNRPVRRRRYGAAPGRAAREGDGCRAVHGHHRLRDVHPPGGRPVHRVGDPRDRGDRRGEELRAALLHRGRVRPARRTRHPTDQVRSLTTFTPTSRGDRRMSDATFITPAFESGHEGDPGALLATPVRASARPAARDPAHHRARPRRAAPQRDARGRRGTGAGVDLVPAPSRGLEPTTSPTLFARVRTPSARSSARGGRSGRLGWENRRNHYSDAARAVG